MMIKKMWKKMGIKIYRWKKKNQIKKMKLWNALRKKPKKKI